MLIWVSHIAKSVFSLFNPTTQSKGFCQFSNIICILNGVINKKIKNTNNKETVFPEIVLKHN
jgi:hypothetical protein